MRAKELIQINNLPSSCDARVTNLTMARMRELLSCIGKIKSYMVAVKVYAYLNKDFSFNVLLGAIELLLERLAIWKKDLQHKCLMAGVENHVYIGLKKWTNDAQGSCDEIANCVKRKKYKRIEGQLNDCYIAVMSMYDVVDAVTRLKQYWYVKQRQCLEDGVVVYKRRWINAVNHGAATRRHVDKAVKQQNTVIRLGIMLNVV
jgi:hypothetical protein